MNKNILNTEKDKINLILNTKNEVLHNILLEFEKIHFLGKKQVNELKKIMEGQNDINEIFNKWGNYLSETIYNDKFTKKFLKITVEKYFNDEVFYSEKH